jgi:Ribbon-helix-helix protein, copG family
MSGDLEGEDMELFAHFNRRPSASLNGRRARETRPLARIDRQRISTQTLKNCQLNLKVTPEFRERVSALARNERISMAELIERAVEAYATQQG